MSVTELDEYVFYNSYNLSHIYYAGTQEQWAAIKIGNGNYHIDHATIHFSQESVQGYNVPTSDWTVTGHFEGVQDASHPMVAAGGVAAGALLHQGYIGVGEIDLSKYSKVIVYFGIDASQVTIDLYNASANNRIMLTSADQAMTNSPTEDVILAGATYSELGWAVHAIEIDLTGVDYAGPVYVTYDTLPGTIMLISSVAFIYDSDYVPPVEEPAPEEPAPEIIDKAAAGMIAESCDTVLKNDELYFSEDGQAYTKLAAVDNTITVKSGDVLGFRGWIGFNQAIDEFGYIVNDGEFISAAEFTQAAEEAVRIIAGENASRYLIMVSTEGAAAGNYTFTWGARLADGTIASFYTITLIIE